MHPSTHWPSPPPPPQFYRVLNIRVALVGLEVWSDADKCPVTQDPFNTLHEFLDWRKVKLLPTKSHDNAQLIRWRSYSTHERIITHMKHTLKQRDTRKFYLPYCSIPLFVIWDTNRL